MKSKVMDLIRWFPNIVCALGAKSTIHTGWIVLACAIAFLGLHAAPLWATEHSGTITSNTTWYATDNPHVIVGNVTVQAGVTLTLEDGVNVQFNHGLSISVYGTLNAPGSTGILFTRYEADDEWRALYFYSGSSGTLQHSTIEYAQYYAGGYGIYGEDATLAIEHSTLENNNYGIYVDGTMPTIESCVIQNNTTGLYVQNVTAAALCTANTIQDNGTGVHFASCTACTVDNQTLEGSNGIYGAIYMQNSGEFTIASGNTIGGVGQENSWPVTIDIGSYPSLASSGHIPTSGNTHNGIQVRGGATAASITWPDVAVDYIITSPPTISAGGILDIDDGVIVKLDHGQYLSVYGTLNAPGSTGILFTRYEAGDEWRGLHFYSGSSGTLQHSTIEYAQYYAGGYGIHGEEATLAIENSTLENNNYGVWASGGTLSFINNQIVNNTSYGIYFSGAVSSSFGSNLSQWNDIYANGGGSAGRDLRNGTLDTFAPYVYWGTVIGAEIEAKIWDENDDPGLGAVCYGPWSTASHDFSILPGLTIALESGSKSSSGDMRLVWDQYCGEGGVDHYVVYRSTEAYAIGDSLAGTTDNTYLDVGVAGDVNTHYYYTVEIIDSVGNRFYTSQVGEFDRNMIAGP